MVSNRHSAIESNNAFTAKIEDLVREIVVQNNILFYRIESSVEHRADGEGGFMPVIRVITYFEDTVSQISDILNAEFEIVEENSVDKKKSQIESFSYKHIQILVGLKANRRELTEYKRSGDKKFEIQICSMLQDAWAGIERELGYDSATFQQEGKRDLYRVGALLEMADLEFLKIRSKFLKHPDTSHVTAPKEPMPQHFTPEQSISGQPVPFDEPSEPVAAKEIYSAPVVTPAQDMIIEPVKVVTVNEVVANDIVEERVAPREEVTAPVAEKPVFTTPVKENEPVAVSMPEPVAKPVFAPAGLAPKPTKIDFTETITTTSAAVVETFVSTPQSIVEPGNTVAEEKAPEAQVASKQAVPVEVPKVSSAPVIIETTPEAVIDESSKPFFEDVIEEEQSKVASKPVVLDENAPITDASLKEYVMKSKLLKEVDKQIAERAGAKINGDIDIEGDVERLRFLKVYTLKQLHDRLKDNNEDIVAFAEKWIGKDNGGSFDSGISLFYLEYLLVGKKNDPAFAVEYVVKFISDNDYSARYIIPTYNSIRSTEAPNFSHLTLK